MYLKKKNKELICKSLDSSTVWFTTETNLLPVYNSVKYDGY